MECFEKLIKVNKDRKVKPWASVVSMAGVERIDMFQCH